jgi:hypothetical protein
MRANKQIWALARYIYDYIPNAAPAEWEEVIDHFYDFAVELSKKISNNEFTGSNNHED